MLRSVPQLALEKVEARMPDYHLNEDVIIALTEAKSYKYLRIHQVIRSEPGLIRDALMETYSNRLHRIWGVRMSARTKVHATNTWGVSIFRYHFGSTQMVEDISERP